MHHRRLACSLACTPGVGLGRSISSRDTGVSNTSPNPTRFRPVPEAMRTAAQARCAGRRLWMISYLPSPFVHLARPPASKRFFPGFCWTTMHISINSPEMHISPVSVLHCTSWSNYWTRTAIYAILHIITSEFLLCQTLSLCSVNKPLYCCSLTLSLPIMEMECFTLSIMEMECFTLSCKS